MAEHNELGKKGEQIAENFLIKNNFRILDKNWRYRHLELDIIALKDDFIVVVEVKTRTTDFIDNLSKIISKKKRLLLIKATNAYINSHKIEKEVRFDIIFIVIKNGKYYLKHIADAFSAIG